MSPRRLLIAVSCALAALAAPAVAQAVTLHGTVGPGFTISLTDDAGAFVSRLDPGTYTIEIDDKADVHNFHLKGPGVDMFTGVEEVNRTIWTVTLQEGVYDYVCDPHSLDMHGTFTVGNVQAPLPPPPPAQPDPPATPPVVAPAAAAKNRLVATVGPGFTISLTLNGKRVKTLKAGTYTIVVRDRSASHNFHIAGPALQRRTSVSFRGTTTWRVRLFKGTYRYVCDPHFAQMKGSFRVT
jgi:plastocyanin